MTQTTVAPPADMTTQEARAYLAPLVAEQAAFDGWSDRAVAAAAQAAGVDPVLAELSFDGPVDMIDAWFGAIDAAMTARHDADALAAMKIRERIAALVMARIEAAEPNREALRRAVAILAMPPNVPRAGRLGWRTVDLMWRLAGDTATDYNHYTKRGLLSAVYASTVAVFLDDESEGLAETRAFLDRRIENVMQFESAKAQLLRPGGERFSVTRFLGRLRYRER